MSSCRNALAALALAAACTVAGAAGPARPAGPVAQKEFPGIGRAATPGEVAAWDIDVRPDFKGLPAGAGSVAKGQDVWESKCASCHGVFGEANEVFSPLVGGTTAEDIKTGHVARLMDRGFPARTTLMKVATVSTLWDYIRRAMPWNAPKSLSTEEVYAVTAYLLNLGGVVPDDFTLSDQNIRDVQQRMPNRNGMTVDHALWPGNEAGRGGKSAKPDVRAVACMHDCLPAQKVASQLPEHALGNNGNLAEQNRLVGPQRGLNTAPAGGAPAAAPAAAPAGGGAPTALLEKNACIACHAMSQKLVGPAFADVAAKYPGKADYLAGKIKSGGSGLWGQIPMPPQTLGDDEAAAIARWLAAGAHP
ncbi:MAG: c-type cytochrome [Pseudomonadota bacterium]